MVTCLKTPSQCMITCLTAFNFSNFVQASRNVSIALYAVKVDSLMAMTINFTDTSTLVNSTAPPYMSAIAFRSGLTPPCVCLGISYFRPFKLSSRNPLKTYTGRNIAIYWLRMSVFYCSGVPVSGLHEASLYQHTSQWTLPEIINEALTRNMPAPARGAYRSEAVYIYSNEAQITQATGFVTSLSLILQFSWVPETRPIDDGRERAVLLPAKYCK